MCVYCATGDWAFKYDRPFEPIEPAPYVPKPMVPGPYIDWNLEKLKEYLRLLEQIKAMEDQIGCPCEPNKADYIKLFKDRIAELEKRLEFQKGSESGLNYE